MLKYILRRIMVAIPLIVAVSIASFIIIQLPPGDFLTTYIHELEAFGDEVSEERIEALRLRYGLNDPMIVQYFSWVRGFVSGDFGYSFEYRRPVSEIIWGRLGMTLLITLGSLLFTWVVAFLAGVYSATHQYRPGDYVFTFLAFIGLAIPNFLLALIFMWFSFSVFGESVGGLFSPEYVDAPWSGAKVLDLLRHIWIPIVVVGTAGTAGTMRVLRANLLDELHKPSVITARAKGVSEAKLLFKYPLRIALLPFMSTIGWTLPVLFSGEAIVGVVLGLPTIGPLLLRALQLQDMYLAGAIVLMLGTLTIIGTVISDIALAWVDPRLRYQ